MTTHKELQQHLRATGRYTGVIDGVYGPLERAAIKKALFDGPDTKLTDQDFANAGAFIDVSPAAIKAFWRVEANGAGFQAGMPKILPEPHRFSKNTGGRFDATNPAVSYKAWGTRPYPATQEARYEVLLTMVGLDIDAGFASCSYGAPQIMGENHALCGYDSPFAFAEAMARDEVTQLKAFIAFVRSAGILPALRTVNRTEKSWEPVAAPYNGTAWRKNDYAGRMVRAYIAFGGR